MLQPPSQGYSSGSAIAEMGLGTQVEALTVISSIQRRYVRLRLRHRLRVCGQVEGRYILNKLAVYYLLAYLDLGVRIEADSRGGVDQICGSVHYVNLMAQASKSQLLTWKACVPRVRVEGTPRPTKSS